MSIDLSRFQETFFEESAEHVETMESGLLELEQRSDDLDLLNRIFRAAHSIKGNAGMFGFTAVMELTHKMENVLDRLRNNDMVVTKDIIDLLLEALDGLKTLLDAAKSGDAGQRDEIALIGNRLVGAVGEPPAPGEGEAASVQQAEPSPMGASHASPLTPSGHSIISISWTPFPELFQRGLDPAKLFQELESLGRIYSVEADMGQLPPLRELNPEVCYLSWTLVLETSEPLSSIEAVFDFVREGSTLSIQPVSQERPGDHGDPEEAEPKRIGEILVDEGAISPEQLVAGLSKQKRLGEILVEEHGVEPQQIMKALDTQQQEKASRSKKSEAASIRVDTEKIDKLINLVGELVITQSMISDLGEKFTMNQLALLQERIIQLERNTRELQERVMSIRMLPIGTAFQRFPRLVRDLASKNGKQLQLMLSGEDTELDKNLIESIGDPLTHLVRNAADHGIGTPEERMAVGKPALGTIRLNAFHEGGNICITVSDDGRGLNREKILAKAVKNGLISEGDVLPDDQIWQLVFQPGFSTAEKITDISGRGVGMDVVKRNIDELGGTVSIHTVEGQGTTFTLKLPLTLAIMEGMTVRVGQEIYIIPLLSVTETIQPKTTEVQTIVGKGTVVGIRGEWVPMIKLYEVFSITPETTDASKALLVILESEGKRIAVLVDELVGQQQVVIKSLEHNYQKVEGVAGATILGDGRVALIMDVQGLLELNKKWKPVAA